MGNIVIADNGRIRKLDDIQLAEDIIKLKNKKDYWTVIDRLIQVWAKKAPDEEVAIQINIGQYKETLKDKEFGQTLLGKDQERRFKLAFPRSLMMYIRSIYKADELKMDDKFYQEFAKRYPAFRVAEKT
jgi:hypothetical protein